MSGCWRVANVFLWVWVAAGAGACQGGSMASKICTVAAPIAVDSDNWAYVALGDDITNQAFGDPITWTVCWEDLTQKKATPKVYNRAKDGETAQGGLKRLDEALAGASGARFVGITFGTNESLQKIDLVVYQGFLRQLVTRVRERGLTPLLSTIPYSLSPKVSQLAVYNEAMLAVRAELKVAAGPDLYTWGMQNPTLYELDQIHFKAEGDDAIAAMWAKSVAELAATLPIAGGGP